MSGFRTIASDRVVGSLRNTDENLPVEIPLLTMYHWCTYLAPIKSLRWTNTQTNRQTDKQTNKLYSINSIRLGPLARRLIAQQWLRWGGIPVGQYFDSRDSRGTFGLQSGFPWGDWASSFIVKYRLSAPSLVIYRQTLKRFLAMKEWSYEKSEHIFIPREKSELSEYLIRF